MFLIMLRSLHALAVVCTVLVAGPTFAAGGHPASAPDQTNSAPYLDQQITLVPWDLEQSFPAIETACCKVCSKGKACGDSCISRKKTCHKPPGCACDAQ